MNRRRVGWFWESTLGQPTTAALLRIVLCMRICGGLHGASGSYPKIGELSSAGGGAESSGPMEVEASARTPLASSECVALCRPDDC